MTWGEQYLTKLVNYGQWNPRTPVFFPSRNFFKVVGEVVGAADGPHEGRHPPMIKVDPTTVTKTIQYKGPLQAEQAECLEA